MSLVKTSLQIFTDDRLGEIVRRILKVGNPQKIVLFGSRARREAQPDSDYDILIIEPSNLPRYKRAVVYRRALIGLGMAKDIIVWTPEEVAEWRNVPNAFITTVLKEGVVLYER
ncbi:MAG: nucleotidyltransferase domain-containing protein [Anaerolineales bacterium]|nr:nucleotidyltransferase domain-containing protein [Anaerolineales bacterium]